MSHPSPDTATLARISSLLARLSGIDPTTSDCTAAAMALLDVERVSSIPGIIAAFQKKREAILADQDLSDHAKSKRILALADSELGNIAIRARQLDELQSKHEEGRATAVPLPKADAVEVLLDLALVAHVKAAEPIPSRLVGMSERVRLAVARTPVELSGITPEVQAQVHGSLMSSAKAVQLSSEAEAIGAARKIVQSAINEMAPQVNWIPKTWVEQFGTKWSLPGVVPSLAERLAAEAAEDDEAV